uniref:Uncharacterized protein n=1 Tax=Arundo donax TaxID=35708 RepID=A0A0A9H3B0_ARUDO
MGLQSVTPVQKKVPKGICLTSQYVICVCL